MKYLIGIMLIGFLARCGDGTGEEKATNADGFDVKYKEITSSKNDIEFYDLVKVEFKDDITSGSISIPRFLTKNKPEKEDIIFVYSYFEEISGYIFSIEKFESKNTQKLTDKQYNDISNSWFQNEGKGDLNEIGKLLSPTMQNARVVDFVGNLKINNKYFLKRIAYFEDKTLDGTIFEGVNCTNFHFVTLHNNRKYTFNINYYGDDKSVSELVGLFNTIGGSISFN